MAIHPPKKPINWVAVRAEYEAGGVTLQQLADKLGVSKRTLERRCSQGSWVEDVGKVSARVSADVSARVQEKVVAQRVKKALTDLDIINSVIELCYGHLQEAELNFRTSGEVIASLDKMLKTKQEFTDERLHQYALSKGYVLTPIAELTQSSENTEGEGFSDLIDIPPE